MISCIKDGFLCPLQGIDVTRSKYEAWKKEWYHLLSFPAAGFNDLPLFSTSNGISLPSSDKAVEFAVAASKKMLAERKQFEDEIDSNAEADNEEQLHLWLTYVPPFLIQQWFISFG